MFRAVRTLWILVLVVSIAGCATARKRGGTGKAPLPAALDYNMMLNEVRLYNITDKGFIIRKGRIELEGTEFDGIYSFNAKVNNKGDLSASVRGPLGIEVIRLMMSGEDICAVDRIGRTAYIGKKNEVLERKGIPGDFMKSIFGDIYDLTYDISDSIIGNKLLLTEETGGFTRETYICADEKKICSERYRSDVWQTDLLLSFSDFVISGETKFPSEILISENLRNIMIKMSIDDISVGYSEQIPFTIPQYKRKSF